jgi:hypothetical protein
MKQLEKTNFVFQTKKYIRENHIQLTDYQFSDLCRILPKGIYWIQVTPGGLIHWNWRLLQSYLLVGADDPSHRSLLEEYVSTLPAAA